MAAALPQLVEAGLKYTFQMAVLSGILGVVIA